MLLVENVLFVEICNYLPLNIFIPYFVAFLVFQGVALSTKVVISASVNSSPKRLSSTIFLLPGKKIKFSVLFIADAFIDHI